MIDHPVGAPMLLLSCSDRPAPRWQWIVVAVESRGSDITPLRARIGMVFQRKNSLLMPDAFRCELKGRQCSERLQTGWCCPHLTCSIPSPPLSATAINPSHLHVTETFFSINYFLFSYSSIVPTRLGLSFGLHIRKHIHGRVKPHYEIVSWP